MRANQDAAGPHHVVFRRPDRLDPPANQLHLVRTRRAGRIPDRGPWAAQGRDRTRRRTPIATSTPSAEEVIEPRRTHNQHVLGGTPVQLDGFLALDGVPDEDAIRLNAHQPLVRQVVPAEWDEDDRHAKPMGGFHVVGLVRLEGDERRDHDDVGAFLAQERLESGIARNELLGPRQRLRCDRPVALDPRMPLAIQHEFRGRDLVRPPDEARGLRVARVEVADVVSRASQQIHDVTPVV